MASQSQGLRFEQVTVFHVEDPVGDIQDPVVMGDQQDGAALIAGKLLHQVDDVAARAAVKCCRRFVG